MALEVKAQLEPVLKPDYMSSDKIASEASTAENSALSLYSKEKTSQAPC